MIKESNTDDQDTPDTSKSGPLTPVMEPLADLDEMEGVISRMDMTPLIKTIMEDNKFVINHRNLQSPFITPLEDVKDLYEKVSENLESDTSEFRVMMELTNVFRVLSLSRLNERELKRKLEDRDTEISRMQEQIRRDPRVGELIKLNDHWRKEKEETENEIVNMNQRILDLKSALQSEKGSLAIEVRNNKRMEEIIRKQALIGNRLQESETRNIQLEHIIEEMQDEIDHLKRRNDLMGRQLDSQNMAVDGEKGLDMSLEHCNRKLEIMKRKADELSFINEEQKQILHKKIEEFSNLEEKHALCKDGFERTKALYKEKLRRVSALEKEIGVLNKIRKKMTGKNEKLEGFKERYHLSVSENTVAFKKFNIESIRLFQILRKKEQECRRMNYSLDKSRTENKQLKCFLHQEYRAKDNIQKSLTQEGQQKLLLQNRFYLQNINLLKSQNELMIERDKVKALEGMTNSLIKHVNAASTELTKSEKQIDELKEKNIYAGRIVQQLAKKCDESIQSVQTTQNSWKSCVLHMGVLEDSIVGLHKQIKVLVQKDLIHHADILHHLECHEFLKQNLANCKRETDSVIHNSNIKDNIIRTLRIADRTRTKELDKVMLEVLDLKKTISKNNNMIHALQNELLQLHNLTVELKAQIPMKQQLLNRMQLERDLWIHKGLQAATEKTLLTEKIGVLERIIAKGREQYGQLLGLMKKVNFENEMMRGKLARQKNIRSDNNILRTELINLTKEQTLLKTKLAMCETVPMLRPSDTRNIMYKFQNEYLRIMKIQGLTRKLIAKTDEAFYLQTELFEKDKNIWQMKCLLARRPGPSCVNSMQGMRAELIAKEKTIIALRGELNMNARELSHLRYIAEENEKSKSEGGPTKTNFHLPKPPRPPKGGGPGGSGRPTQTYPETRTMCMQGTIDDLLMKPRSGTDKTDKSMRSGKGRSYRLLSRPKSLMYSCEKPMAYGSQKRDLGYLPPSSRAEVKKYDQEDEEILSSVMKQTERVNPNGFDSETLSTRTVRSKIPTLSKQAKIPAREIYFPLSSEFPTKKLSAVPNHMVTSSEIMNMEKQPRESESKESFVESHSISVSQPDPFQDKSSIRTSTDKRRSKESFRTSGSSHDLKFDTKDVEKRHSILTKERSKSFVAASYSASTFAHASSNFSQLSNTEDIEDLEFDQLKSELEDIVSINSEVIDDIDEQGIVQPRELNDEKINASALREPLESEADKVSNSAGAEEQNANTNKMRERGVVEEGEVHKPAGENEAEIVGETRSTSMDMTHDQTNDEKRDSSLQQIDDYKEFEETAGKNIEKADVIEEPLVTTDKKVVDQIVDVELQGDVDVNEAIENDVGQEVVDGNKMDQIVLEEHGQNNGDFLTDLKFEANDEQVDDRNKEGPTKTNEDLNDIKAEEPVEDVEIKKETE